MPEQRTAKDREQHLYLVFDDWDSGYSIRKVSLSRRSSRKRAGQPLPSGSGEEGAKPLPGVFLHVRAPRGNPDLFTSAFGKIMAMHPGMPNRAGITMIDVQEKTVIFRREANGNDFPIYFPVGENSLFALDMASFDCFRWMPEHSEEQSGWHILHYPPFYREDVSSYGMEHSEEQSGWHSLHYPPFYREDVSSYGVRPDGCILASTNSGITFVFDTKEYVWKQYGNWVFPFTGRGHYDTSLEGFVGLSEHPETLGYLYCSTMPSTGTGLDTGQTLHPSPDFKRTKEKVCSNNPAERHVSATLVHMSQGKFCLVECVCIDENRSLSWADEFELPLGALPWDFVGGGPQDGGFLYRLKTFSLAYDTKGDLKLKHCKDCCYSLPHEARIGSICMDPVAFWL